MARSALEQRTRQRATPQLKTSLAPIEAPIERSSEENRRVQRNQRARDKRNIARITRELGLPFEGGVSYDFVGKYGDEYVAELALSLEVTPIIDDDDAALALVTDDFSNVISGSIR